MVSKWSRNVLLWCYVMQHPFVTLTGLLSFLVTTTSARRTWRGTFSCGVRCSPEGGYLSAWLPVSTECRHWPKMWNLSLMWAWNVLIEASSMCHVSLYWYGWLGNWVLYSASVWKISVWSFDISVDCWVQIKYRISQHRDSQCLLNRQWERVKWWKCLMIWH